MAKGAKMLLHDIQNTILERRNPVLLLLLCKYVHNAQGTPTLDLETGWAGEFWTKSNLLKWPNSDKIILI